MLVLLGDRDDLGDDLGRLAALGTVLFGIFPGWWLQLISTGQRLIAGL
ncbi:MAG: hypothetical protein OXC09_05620 [Truepera sp.]|nr:hypothetical protein [Truepera sp.]